MSIQRKARQNVFLLLAMRIMNIFFSSRIALATATMDPSIAIVNFFLAKRTTASRKCDYGTVKLKSAEKNEILLKSQELLSSNAFYTNS